VAHCEAKSRAKTSMIHHPQGDHRWHLKELCIAPLQGRRAPNHGLDALHHASQGHCSRKARPNISRPKTPRPSRAIGLHTVLQLTRGVCRTWVQGPLHRYSFGEPCQIYFRTHFVRSSSSMSPLKREPISRAPVTQFYPIYPTNVMHSCTHIFVLNFGKSSFHHLRGNT
jgi:hypothetical protein